MNIVSIVVFAGVLAIILAIFLLIRKAIRTGIAILALVMLLACSYKAMPEHLQTSVKLTVAINTNGIIGEMTKSSLPVISKNQIIIDPNGKFTYVMPVTTAVSNSPIVTKENIHTFDINMFTFDTKVLGYTVKCRYEDLNSVKAKLTKLGIY